MRCELGDPMFKPQIGDIVNETGPWGNKLSSWIIISMGRNSTFTMECTKKKEGGRYDVGDSKTLNIDEITVRRWHIPTNYLEDCGDR